MRELTKYITARDEEVNMVTDDFFYYKELKLTSRDNLIIKNFHITQDLKDEQDVRVKCSGWVRIAFPYVETSRWKIINYGNLVGYPYFDMESKVTYPMFQRIPINELMTISFYLFRPYNMEYPGAIKGAVNFTFLYEALHKT